MFPPQPKEDWNKGKEQMDRRDVTAQQQSAPGCIVLLCLLGKHRAALTVDMQHSFAAPDQNWFQHLWSQML